jgi:hypothetical protein
MITERYQESLKAALGYDFQTPSDGDVMLHFYLGELKFDFAVGVVTNAQERKSESRPYAMITCALLQWDSLQDSAEDVLYFLAKGIKGKAYPYGLRLVDLQDESRKLYLEYFTLLTLSVEQDADSLRFLVDGMADVTRDIQNIYPRWTSAIANFPSPRLDGL